MSDIEAFAPAPASFASLDAARHAEPGVPLPRAVGLLIALGLSLALWAALIEGGIRAWAMFARL